ncbi:hypothetical protein HYDPIDRAFT_93958 [Hydnomerulius pinastri MD-312]|uniref:Unplaced genomic scaffold scaffold_20, whole genome shotgun sequence n=1 Tax=Hydnomerulius pinastri MD-312 TaxID=994086 RepID=A0A0C9VA39_9AGAM|nr:hypothetical protein HYDPIDRAFT_93958 [Hydnomerulius pinastri MD-312]
MGRESVPPYTPSPPSPSYSTELLPGERTVEQARRALSQPPTGVYRRITENLSIVLRDQRPGSIHPIYGRGAVVRGDLMLRNTDDLTSVTLKLEGLMVVESSGVSIPTTLFSMSFEMWSASGGRPCPRTVPFAAILPPTFEDGDHARPLPPTFESMEPRAVCSYSLTVELSRPRQFLSFLKSSDAVKVPFIYRPRSRPHMPMLPSDLPFMSTVKSSPEEWHQVMCTMNMAQSTGLAPAQCLLFIPSAQIYALSDTIPFHLQIRGPPASLIPFLEQSQGTQQPGGGVAIRVYLLRQTGIKIHDQIVSISRVLGEAKVEPSQSRHSMFQRGPLGDALDSLDWDGEVRCSEDTTVASFFTSQLYVKDFIALSIVPRKPLQSTLLALKHCHPIRLVTDPWSDQVISW